MALAGARFVFVPGVPHESERMLEEQVIPALEAERAAAGAGAVVVRRLNCFGLPESKVDALLAPLFPGPDPALAFNISDGVVQVYLTARAAGRAVAEARLEAAAARVREKLGPCCFSEAERSLEETLVELCRERKLRIAVAESCTGGLAGSRIARVPGASDVFRGGVIAYSNEVKQALLGVPAEVLERHGAVSRECALAMAAGARRATGASLAASITGIAGPGGATPAKPVGLVYVAVAGDGVERVRELRLPGDRQRVQHLSALAAIEAMRRAVLGLPE
jgi:nicotinamide-nucleotide amidase